jgi:hypothetical protein
MTEPPKQWDAALVRAWLESRIAAARADQVAAERAGYGRRDDCDKAAAEEMICTALKNNDATNTQIALADELKTRLAQDDYIWRGVYDDVRFDRYVKTFIRKLIKMTKTNEGFGNTRRYQ